MKRTKEAMMKGISLAGWMGGVLFAVVGCGGAEEPPPAVPEPTPPPATVAAPEPPPPAAPAEPTPCDSMQSSAMMATIQGRAPTEAPKMQPEGQPVCAVVQEGQSTSGPMFVLQQGMCYTVLAQSMPGVTEVDVALELDMTGMPPAIAALNLKPELAVDSDTGASGAVGPKGNCYTWIFPIPGPVKVKVKARTGSGPVSAQLYSRKK